MARHFNTQGICFPEEHYMVNLDERIYQIKKLVEQKKYFCINRGRQYGKTTTLEMLQRGLRDEYTVFFISFEGIAEDSYQNEKTFCSMFSGLLFDAIDYGEVTGVADFIADELERMSRADTDRSSFRDLSNLVTRLCETADKPVVLIIDEVDQAGNYPIFLTFLGMLRNKYLKRTHRLTFQTVILAGVYDIRNLKHKIRDDKEHQKNSPWNIASEFDVDMKLECDGIKGMLSEYEIDHNTGMNIESMAELLFSYTSGYPFLVSRLCQIIDEKLKIREGAWTKEGLLEALKLLLQEKNPLFESLANKLEDYPELRQMLYSMLFTGEKIVYNSQNDLINLAAMLGFVENDNGMVAITNRIFEICLYNLFLSEDEMNHRISSVGSREKNQFVQNNELNMELILEKFMLHWGDLYNSADDRFIEDNGRKFFLLYLKPIINGVGNYYIESRTRDNGRTDIVVDYLGKQYIIEVKIWRGDEYNRRGEMQLGEYLDAYHVTKGYLLSFNFNKNKEVGFKTIECNGKTIFEVVV